MAYPYSRKQLDDREPLFARRDFMSDGYQYREGERFDSSSVSRSHLSALWSQHYVDHKQVTRAVETDDEGAVIAPSAVQQQPRDKRKGIKS